MSKIVEMTRPCGNCEEPKKPGKICTECGFWEPHDLEVNPELKREIENLRYKKRLE